MEKEIKRLLRCFKRTELSEQDVADAIIKYSDQEKEKEAIEFADFLVKNYQPRFPNKSDWVKILDSNKFKKIYTTTELYQIFKKNNYEKIQK